jgi:drug/metabolite transporter (DMT)-like permease
MPRARVLALAAAILAPLIWSVGGVVMRSVETAGAWEQVAWRSLGGAVAVAVLLAPRGAARAAGAVRDAGWAGIASMICIAATFVVHVLAINATSVANVLFLQTASPLLMPLLAWGVLRETPHRLTFVSMAIAMAGLAPIVAGSVGGGNLVGDMLALASAACGAANVLIVRRLRDLDMMPVAAIAAALAGLFATVVGAPMAVAAADAIALVLLGALQIAGGLTLFFFALRHLPAAPVALLTLLEPVAGPLLVWAAIGEIPPPTTLVGGGIIAAALLVSIGATALVRAEAPAGSGARPT